MNIIKLIVESFEEKLYSSKATVRRSAFVINNYKERKGIKPEHIDIGLKDPDPYIRYHAARHSAATPGQLMRALDDPDENVRAAVCYNPSATDQHIAKALNDRTPWIRSIALDHPLTTHDQIVQALKDPVEGVRNTAKQRVFKQL